MQCKRNLREIQIRKKIIKPLLTGVKVAKFQESGLFSAKSYMSLIDGLDRDVKDFTLCAWLSLNYIRGKQNTWISISNETHDSLLIGGKS